MDGDTAIWLADLLPQATMELDKSPGVLIEADGHHDRWLQLVLEDGDNGLLLGFAVNFPYRNYAGDPAGTLKLVRISLPPDSHTLAWEDGGFATIWVSADMPVVALAHLAGDILKRIVGASHNTELGVQIEYGTRRGIDFETANIAWKQTRCS